MRTASQGVHQTGLGPVGQLRMWLLEYARSHGGKFPPHDFIPEIPEKIWQSPDAAGTHYIYLGGFTTNDTGKVLAYEPDKFGEKRFVMFGGGEIKQMTLPEIEALIFSKH